MAKLIYTSVDDIPTIHNELKAGFSAGKLRSIEYRKKQLAGLAYMIKDNEKEWQAALHADLGRPVLESNFMELINLVTETVVAYHNVEKWAKPEKPPFNVNFFAMGPHIRKEAKGTVLIIGPFNFPLWSLLRPLVGAIAAGNAACLKPSEQTPAVSSRLAELLPKYLDSSLYRVVNGSVPETTKLLELRWDHIFYTGSGRTGKIVSVAAAQHLTPVSLELGGKSPVVIDPKCDVDVAARRILWGGFANAGQVCIRPDYVLVPKDFQETFVEALKKHYKTFFPNGAHTSSSFGRIVSHSQFARIKSLLDNTAGTIVAGGETVEGEKYVAPTIVKDVPLDDSLMSEEIFGPVLPIVPIADVDAAIAYINSKDHPLALYVFSKDAKFKAKVFDNTQSGSAVANDTVLQAGVDGLPFGGIGQSGSGYHTGKAGFDMFTHTRSSIDSPGFVDYFLSFRFPPYTDKNLRFMNAALYPKLPKRDGTPGGWTKWVLFSLALALCGAYVSGRVKL